MITVKPYYWSSRQHISTSCTDELFDRVIKALTSESVKKPDGVRRSSHWSYIDHSERNRRGLEVESSINRLRHNILESIECRKFEFENRDKQTSESRSSRSLKKSDRDSKSKSNNSIDVVDATPPKTKHSTLSKKSHQKHQQESVAENSSSKPVRSRSVCGSSKHDWMASLKEMADPKNELSASSSFLDISNLNVQTTALTTDDDLFNSSSSYNFFDEFNNKEFVDGGHRRRRSRSMSPASAELDHHLHTPSTTRRRRSERRRSRGDRNKNKLLLYRCSTCESSVLVNYKVPSDQVRCLYCDYWTSVEPEFQKDEKTDQNFCKIS